MSAPGPDPALKREDWRNMLVVGALAFAVRVLYLVSYSRTPYWDALVMDPKSHWDLAQALAAGQGMGPYAYFRAPLYMYLLAGFVKAFGDSLWPIRIFQALLGSATAVLTARLARYYLKSYAAGLAGAVIALYWIMIYFDGELLTETLATFLGLAALVLLIKADLSLKRAGIRLAWFFAAGAFAGLGAISRPNILAFAALVPVVLFVRALLAKPEIVNGRPRHRIIVPLLAGVIFSAGTALCIAPATIRNFAVAHDHVLIASQGGINFWIGNHEDADGRIVVVPIPRRAIPLSFLKSRSDHPWLNEDVWLSSAYGAEDALKKRVRESEISDYWYGQALAWMERRPADAALLLAKKALYLFQAKEVSNNRDLLYHREKTNLSCFKPRSFGVFAPFILAGMVLAFRRFRLFLWPLLFFLAYALSVIAFFITTRYRVPLLPVGMTFLALVIEEVESRLRENYAAGLRAQLRSLAPVLAMLAIFAFLSNMPWPAWNDRPLRSAMHYNLGIALFEKNNLPGAAAEFQEALKIKDFYPEAHFWLGKIMISSEKMSAAAAEMEEAVKQAPAYAPAHYELSRIYARLSRQKGDDYWVRSQRQAAIAHRIEPMVYPSP